MVLFQLMCTFLVVSTSRDVDSRDYAFTRKNKEIKSEVDIQFSDVRLSPVILQCFKFKSGFVLAVGTRQYRENLLNR